MITAQALEKRYGTKRALGPISFSLEPQGFLVVTGANGSGKTTLLRLLVGLSAPTRGSLAVDVDRRSIGFLGHEPLLYGELTGRENLRLYAGLYRLGQREAKVSAALARVGLTGAADERARSYSRGMTQRLSLARAVLHEPRFLALDEPHTALDGDGAAVVDELLAAMRGVATIVVSTHDPERVLPHATATLELA